MQPLPIVRPVLGGVPRLHRAGVVEFFQHALAKVEVAIVCPIQVSPRAQAQGVVPMDVGGAAPVVGIRDLAKPVLVPIHYFLMKKGGRPEFPLAA